MYIATFKFHDSNLQIGIHDVERVCRTYPDVHYYITPKRCAKAQVWMINNNIQKVTAQDAYALIDLDIIGTYS